MQQMFKSTNREGFCQKVLRFVDWGHLAKTRLENQGSSCYFLSSRGQKIKNITKIEQKRLFVYILGFIFYGVSCAKTDLHNKYMI